MSLVADYSSSSESDNISNSDSDSNDARIEAKAPLPRADILLSGGKTGQVFNNPYKEAENAKIALLEKHVKMVDNQKHSLTKNGKKICWNYQKGRCRFGNNCTFAHGSDLSVQKDDEEKTNKNNIPLSSTISKSQSGLQLGTKDRKRNNTDSDSATSHRKATKHQRKHHN